MTPSASSESPPPAEAGQAVQKHPRAVRWMHWVNFPLLAVMIWSGLRIYWANDVYRIGWGGWTLFAFFPDGFYEALDLNRHLARGMAYHYFFGWLFTINGVLYVGYTVVSGEWRHLCPDRHALRDAWHTALHDLRLRKTPPPQGRYNAAQRLTYVGIIVMGAGSVLTGLAIYKPTQLAWLITLLGGYSFGRTIHFVLTLLYVAFFVIHLAQVVRAGWSNFWGMMMGYERLKPDEAASLADPDTEPPEASDSEPPEAP